jgi:hypothetical protein
MTASRAPRRQAAPAGISRRLFLGRLAHAAGFGAAAWAAAACTAPASPVPPVQQVTPIPAPASPLPSPSAAPSPSKPLPSEASPAASPASVSVPILPAAQRALRQVSKVEQVARLVGPGALHDTSKRWGLDGADLGSLFDMDGKVYMVFGDSYGCCIPGTGGPGQASDWRKNCMAIIAPGDPAAGLIFADMITDRPGHAAELLHRGKFDVTCIPTNGIAAGRRMFLHYMGVLAWGKPGEWALNEAGLAYSDDGGHTWTKDPACKWDAGSNFGQVAFARPPTGRSGTGTGQGASGEAGTPAAGTDPGSPALYVFGIPGGRFGAVKLARVGEANLLDKRAYRYHAGLVDGEPAWSPDESAAVPIVPPPVGELSVMWNNYLGRWIMTYLDERQAALVIREAPAPWGPWSPGLPLVAGSAFPGLYAPYMHPHYVENDGETVYFSMSLWGPYAVYWMRARLLRA